MRDVCFDDVDLRHVAYAVHDRVEMMYTEDDNTARQVSFPPHNREPCGVRGQPWSSFDLIFGASFFLSVKT